MDNNGFSSKKNIHKIINHIEKSLSKKDNNIMEKKNKKKLLKNNSYINKVSKNGISINNKRNLTQIKSTTLLHSQNWNKSLRQYILKEDNNNLKSEKRKHYNNKKDKKNNTEFKINSSKAPLKKTHNKILFTPITNYLNIDSKNNKKIKYDLLYNEKIKKGNLNLNFNSNISVINTLSNISNIIKVSKDNNDNSNSTSNDFDLSVSGTFYKHSPRFNSLENETSNISNNNNKSIKKDGLICESLFNELKNSPINTFNNSYGSFCDLDDNISSKKIIKSKSNNTSITKNININITSNYNSNTNSSKNKNFVNILDCSFGDIITNDNEKMVKRPSLPSVQPNELSFDNNI
jgi:hypothetical protein